MGNKALPEFGGMREKPTCQARESCSTKAHIRTMDGSVRVTGASNPHAGPCRAEMPKQRWLKMRFVSQLSLAWQYLGRESMLIDFHPIKFRKNRK